MQQDYFSSQSAAYRRHRPFYPDALFAYLAEHVTRDARAWDCATGNGQAAAALARHVGGVLATDWSFAQLSHAARVAKALYVQARAEATPLPDGFVDLLTVAQALHWLDFERFYAEVRRVLRPGALVAAWTYSFLTVSPQLGADLDAAVRRFYHDVVGAYWPPERRWVDERYRTLPFPFAELGAPAFTIETDWTLDALLGYVGSWSAVQRYGDAHGRDPLPALEEELAPLWGDRAQTRCLSWPLSLRVGRCD